MLPLVAAAAGLCHQVPAPFRAEVKADLSTSCTLGTCAWGNGGSTRGIGGSSIIGRALGTRTSPNAHCYCLYSQTQALREPLLFAGCSGADALRKTRAQQRPGSGGLPYTNCCARSLSVTSLLPPVSRAHRDDDFLNAYLDCATSGEFEAAHTL